MTHPLAPLARRLGERHVRYVLIGVSGANLYGPGGQAVFTTDDVDLSYPSIPTTSFRRGPRARTPHWTCGSPTSRSIDHVTVGSQSASSSGATLTRATGPDDLMVDLTLVMKGFEFDQVWAERRTFVIEGVDVPTARLRHIVESKHATGRDKDKLFLATHKDALEQLLKPPDRP